MDTLTPALHTRDRSTELLKVPAMLPLNVTRSGLMRVPLLQDLRHMRKVDTLLPRLGWSPVDESRQWLASLDPGGRSSRWCERLPPLPVVLPCKLGRWHREGPPLVRLLRHV